jgi:uncharacterized protein (DUF2141 family)
MKLKHFAISLAASSFPLIGAASGAKAENADLTVVVSGLHSFKGQVVLTLWPASKEPSKFPDASKMQTRDEHDAEVPCDFEKYAICRRKIESLQNLTVSYTFKSVPAGEYAVFVFHDENNNGMLDTGLMQRPLEARGFSQVVPDDVPLVRKIPFNRAKFNLSGQQTITIGLKYPPRI